jgi:hypothetical protein
MHKVSYAMIFLSANSFSDIMIPLIFLLSNINILLYNDYFYKNKLEMIEGFNPSIITKPILIIIYKTYPNISNCISVISLEDSGTTP